MRACVQARDPASILSGVEETLKEALPQMGFQVLSDVQVLTPLNKGAIGTLKLNQVLYCAVLFVFVFVLELKQGLLLFMETTCAAGHWHLE